MSDVREQMRAEWNQRASEDAHYYVAFGRREQDDDEFFATAADVVRALERELKRLPPRGGPRRALEIGCGPGRLLKPMSRHFDEIHGVDVSDLMIERARRNLAAIPQAHAHHSSGADLALFPDASFDFVYSYAVFQHIPSRDVVLSYFREVVRVLKPGAVAHLQVNGLRPKADGYTTWDGVRFSGDEIRAFTREQNVHLLALEGLETQYMWTTWRKPEPGAAPRIHHITDSLTGEPAVPASGRYAFASLLIENLPREADLNNLRVKIDAKAAEGVYVGPPQNGLSLVNVAMPAESRTGLLPVEASYGERPLAPPAWVRVIPPGPLTPRVQSVTDGTNLMAERRIESGAVKLMLEEISDPELLRVTVAGQDARDLAVFCTDPRNQIYDCSFRLPEVAPGWHELIVRLGSRALPAVWIEVV